MFFLQNFLEQKNLPSRKYTKKHKLNLIAKTITLVLLSGASLNSFATTNENPNKIRKDVNYNNELNRLNARIIASKNDTANLNTTANMRGAVAFGNNSIATGATHHPNFFNYNEMRNTGNYSKGFELANLKRQIREKDYVIEAQRDGIIELNTMLQQGRVKRDTYNTILNRAEEYIIKKEKEKEELNKRITELEREIKKNDDEKTTSGSIAFGDL